MRVSALMKLTASVLLLLIICIQTVFAFGFIEHMIDDDLDGACFAFAVDLNGDDLTDIVATGWEDESVTRWYENEGNFTFVTHELPETAPGRHVMCFDLDDDGDQDIVLSSFTINGVAWWENDGSGSFTYHFIASTPGGAHTSDVCDIDDDGDNDILTACWNSGVIIFENDGEENFTEINLGTEGDGNSDIHGFDIDLDGDLDVLAVQYMGSTVTWWENQGEDGFQMYEFPESINGAHWASPNDLDGDTDIDIIVAAYNANRVYWMENDGNQNFTLHEIISLGGASWIETGDIDLDGDFDVLVSGETSNRILWLENDGAMNLTAHPIKSGWARVMGEQLIDFDNDGDIDFVGAAVNADEVILFENDSNYAQATNSWVSELVVQPNTGEVIVTADVDDNGATDIDVYADINSVDGAMTEMVQLFDDGLNNDGEANDGIWGATYTAGFWEDFYEVIIRVENNDNTQNHSFHNNLFFTTSGPLEFEGIGITLASDTIPEPGESTSIAAMFQNVGVQGIIRDIRMDISIMDTLVEFGNGTRENYRYLPEIAPGEVVQHLSPLNMNIGEDFPVDSDIHFDIRLSYSEIEFWNYEGILHVYGGSDVNESSIPEKFQINRCYPNPFNSTLRLEFVLPKFSNMEIAVYNLLGEKVDTICSKNFQAGQHQLIYHATNLASGTYLIRFDSEIEGQFIQKVQFIK